MRDTRRHLGALCKRRAYPQLSLHSKDVRLATFGGANSSSRTPFRAWGPQGLDCSPVATFAGRNCPSRTAARDLCLTGQMRTMAPDKSWMASRLSAQEREELEAVRARLNQQLMLASADEKPSLARANGAWQRAAWRWHGRASARGHVPWTRRLGSTILGQRVGKRRAPQQRRTVALQSPLV